MAKQGFGGQWIAIARKGKFADSTDVERNLDDDFLKAVVSNFTAHNAPAVIGHPKENNPAFGWVSALRLNGDVLEAQFADTDDEFERMVADGKFRKRSASFYLGDKPSLRHVGFLGAVPPAVRGLPDIQFNDGEKTAVEISFNEEKIMDKENENAADEKKTFSEWVKEIFGGQQPAPAPANFSAADAKSLISTAVTEVSEKLTTDFNEKLSAKDAEIETLTKQVNAVSSNGKRAEIVSFVESIPAESGKHFLKRAGIVEFLEACAAADAKDAEKAVVCFSEGDDGKKEEVKLSRLEWAKNLFEALPPMISFGESFGNLKATAEADIQVNPQELSDLREAMGVKTAEGGAK